jgi:hypothetical protein
MSSRAPTAAPGDLARFQDAFLRALLAGEQTIPDGATALPDVPTPLPDVATAIANGATSAPPVRATRESLFAHPGFAVYRNTVVTGCIDALAANYPAVVRLVGDEWFRAAAAVHVRRAPPSHPCLFDYGDGFAEFLAAFAPAAGLPYLPDIARLDRLWTEAHLAADEPPLDASRVAALAPGELARTVLAPHASARWAWFDRNPTWSIWRHARAGTPPDEGAVFEPAWQAEGALLVRAGDAVEAVEARRGDCVFLDACAAGQTLAECAAAALAADPGVDLAATMARLMRAGAFARLRTTSPDEECRP